MVCNLLSRLTLLLFFMACSVVLQAPAVALSYIQVSDQELFLQADLVVEAQIIDRFVTRDVGSAAPESTEYELELLESFKGWSVSRRIRMQVPGVHPSDGHGWRFDAAPRFDVGDTVLVFLQGGQGNRWQLPHLGLSAFRMDWHEGQAIWRNLLNDGHDEAKGYNQRYRLARHADGFRQWLRQQPYGGFFGDDYFLRVDPPLSSAGFESALKEQPGGLRGRWNRFEQNQAVYWYSLDEQQLHPDIDQAGVVQRALASWTNHPHSEIQFRFGGLVDREFAELINDINSNSEFRGVGIVLWDDPFDNDSTVDPYSCPGTGVFGWATWLPEVGEGNATHFHLGQEYETMRLARVVVNRQAECVLNQPDTSGLNAEELVAHEMGHGLGFAHSCENEEKEDLGIPACNDPDTAEIRDQALMRYTLRRDTGARLGEYDRERAKTVYPQSLSEPLFLLSARAEAGGNVRLTDLDAEETQDCDRACDVLGTASTRVRLTAVAEGSDSVFLGWAGDCANRRGNPIEVSIGSGGDCLARFEPWDNQEQGVIQVNRPDCGVRVTPDDWRSVKSVGESLFIDVVATFEDGSVDLVDSSSICASSRVDETDTWQIDPVSGVVCKVSVFLQGIPPSCDDLFNDRFESTGQ